MIQWIVVAIILAVCLLYICRAIYRRCKGGGNNPCCGCDADCCRCKNKKRR